MVKPVLTKEKVQNLLFLFAFFPWYMSNYFLQTTYKDFFLFDGLFRYRMTSVLALVFLFFKFWVDRYFSKKETLFFLLGTLFFFLVSLQSGEQDILLSFFFVFSARNLDLEKLLKKICFFLLCLLCFTHFLYILEIAKDLTALRSLGHFRRSLGYSFITFPSNFFLYATLLWIYIKKHKIGFASFLCFLLLNLYVFWQTDTKSSLAYSLLALFLALVWKIYFHFKASLHMGPLIEKTGVYLEKFALVLPVFSVFVSFALAYFYQEQHAFWEKLNQLVTGRLALGHLALQRYGFSFFGQDVLWKFWEDGEYFFVDSAYLHLYLKYGVLLMLLLPLAFTYLSKHFEELFVSTQGEEVHKNKAYFLLCSSLLALHAMFDPQYFDLLYNPFLFFFAPLFLERKDFFMTHEPMSFFDLNLFMKKLKKQVFFFGITAFLLSALYTSYLYLQQEKTVFQAETVLIFEDKALLENKENYEGLSQYVYNKLNIYLSLANTELTKKMLLNEKKLEEHKENFVAQSASFLQNKENGEKVQVLKVQTKAYTEAAAKAFLDAYVQYIQEKTVENQENFRLNLLEKEVLLTEQKTEKSFFVKRFFQAFVLLSLLCFVFSLAKEIFLACQVFSSSKRNDAV